MTETAPPQEKPDKRSKLGIVNDQVVDLAVLNVVVGGGLVLGALALFLLRDLPSIGYSERMTAFWVAFWIGGTVSLLAGLGFVVRAARGWSAFLRRFVAAAGAAGFALLVFQIGLFGRWDLRTLVALLCIGAVLLIAGLAIWRARRWGGYLAIVIAVGICCYAALELSAAGMPTGELIFFGLVLLLILLAFFDPLSTLLLAEPGVFSFRFGPFRILSRLVFGAFVTFTIIFWILMSTLGSPNLLTSMQRSRQRHTMSDMRSMMDALDKYAETNKIYPPTQDVAGLARVLEPAYIPVLPRNDAWGWPLEYYRVTLPSGVQGVVIRSAGCDGLFEQKDPTAYTDEFVMGMERDLVFSTVSKSQVPEGTMGF